MKKISLSRREYLGLAGVAALSSLYAFSRIHGEGATAAPNFNMVFDPFCFFDPNSTQKTDSVVLLVHPAYLTYEGIPGYVRGSFTLPQYGDYTKYLANIMKLREKRRSAGFLTLLGIEHDRFIHINKLPEAFRPDKNSVVIVTKASSGIPVEVVQYEEGILQCQYLTTIFSFLRDNGISTVYCGGEFAWYDINKADAKLIGDGNGCLTILANLFRDNGFTVRGIQGCIFPLAKPVRENHPSMFLYTDQTNRRVNGSL